MTMMGSPCLAAGFLINVAAVLFVISALALIFIILLQRGRGGGLSAALGGGMATGILGSKTGDFLTWVTIGLVGVFLFLAVLLAMYWRPTTSKFGAAPGPAARQTAPAGIPDQNAGGGPASGPNSPSQ